MTEISTTARMLRDQAELLESLLAKFTFDGPAAMAKTRGSAARALAR
jgi:hypothetical protein